MPVDLRATMRHLATGVCVVTTYAVRDGRVRHDALTVNSVLPLSYDPPLTAVSLRRGSAFRDDLLAAGHWAISVLDSAADDIARTFAKSRDRRTHALPTVSTAVGTHSGALILDSLGWLECRLREHREVGDHTVVVGDVLAAGAQRRRPPLMFLGGNFHTVDEPGARQGTTGRAQSALAQSALSERPRSTA